MKTYIVDAFTKEAFKGNPAGVCLPENTLSEETMLQIAKEFGLSETAFIRATSKINTYSIRYFSPKKEIPLCGHATLAAAKVLFKTTDLNEIYFITSAFLNLLIKKQNDEIIMEFPVYETIAINAPPAMIAALGLTTIVNSAFSKINKIILLEITDAELLANLKPDFDALINSYEHINGVLVTSPGIDNLYDFHYRYFWPWAGTNEDPVTGGVQTFLAKYWSEKINKKKMKAFQSSERTGYMTVELNGDKVLISSSAVIILEGNLSAFN